ncbi:MAG: RNA-binding protein [Crenarchaeota archaeon]|nr:MAG: RNA-binding protein [Thermoproteota archaeon]RDJ33550.1 MAG: RNA-binding protein [Thermoproteota archaeon]RDJ38128.1 MAG: RNA-binding protein [Thermoproteota archaeon]RDJ39103.1 MAG: RNA-binding protein [Thermoproteota archaeon]
MSLKNVKSSLDKISKSFSVTQDAREFLIKNTREVVILSSQAIIAVHKQDLKSAKEKAKKANTLLTSQKKKAVGELQRYIIIPEQELVEAFALIAIAEKKPVPSIDTLKVNPESYILGLLDCVGELKRLTYDKIRKGEPEEAIRIFGVMEDLYQNLYPFATYDKIVRETRRKLDVNRILVEDVRAALTEEIRRSDLINAIKKLEK